MTWCCYHSPLIKIQNYAYDERTLRSKYSRYIHARIARQKRRDYLNFASIQRYAYKQSTRKLSRSWLPTGRNTLVRMSVHPHPFLVSSSCFHPSVVPLPRRGFFPGSRGSWARNTINSLRESPRVTASKNIYFPNAPIGSTYFRKPLPTHPPIPLAELSLPKRFLSFRLPLFGSARTRLFAGLRYLHKSAMQSLFIFRAKVWREYTRRPVCA